MVIEWITHKMLDLIKKINLGRFFLSCTGRGLSHYFVYDDRTVGGQWSYTDLLEVKILAGHPLCVLIYGPMKYILLLLPSTFSSTYLHFLVGYQLIYKNFSTDIAASILWRCVNHLK